LRKTLKNILRSFALAAPWENLPRDLRSLVHAMRKRFPRPARARPSLQILAHSAAALLRGRNGGRAVLVDRAERHVSGAVRKFLVLTFEPSRAVFLEQRAGPDEDVYPYPEEIRFRR